MRRRTPHLNPLPFKKEERRIQRVAETSLSAVLLAGGESRRMGKDKATLSYRGKPLWQIQLGLFSELTPQ